MKGHIRKRGERSWAVVLDLGRDPGGKRRQKWHSVRGTKKDAERELAKLVHALNTGDYVEPAKLTLAEYLEQWLDSARANVSGKTYERYEEIVRRHLAPALGSRTLSKLQPLQIQSYYSRALETGRLDGAGGLSRQTVLHHHRVLSEALNRAVKWQLIVRNPADAVEAPRPARKEMNALDEAQTAWLLEVVDGTDLNIPVLLAVTTGMRRGEFLALRWTDIDFDTATAAVNRSLEQTNKSVIFKSPKGRRGRVVSLPRLTLVALKEHRESQLERQRNLGAAYHDNGLICAKHDGSIWKPDTLTADFARLAKRACLKSVRLHDLRHSHASQLLRRGVHPKVVSERLGHSTVGITLDVYSHVLPGIQEEAAGRVDAALREAIEKRRKMPS